MASSGRHTDELWFICNKKNAKKIIKVLIKHGYEGN